MFERERAADMYRDGLDIAHDVSDKDKARMVESDTGNLSVDYMIQTMVMEIENNLSILEGRGRTMPRDPSLQGRDFGKKDDMPVNDSLVMAIGGGQDEEEFARAMDRASIVGGNKCDQCGLTLEEANRVKLDCCSRCMIAYYCSKSCQVKSWKAGHEKACRKPDQIEVGDFMILKGLTGKRDLNGRVGRIQGAAEKDGRWIVQLSSEGDAISVSAGNLQHIRPAK